MFDPGRVSVAETLAAPFRVGDLDDLDAPAGARREERDPAPLEFYAALARQLEVLPEQRCSFGEIVDDDPDVIEPLDPERVSHLRLELREDVPVEARQVPPGSLEHVRVAPLLRD